MSTASSQPSSSTQPSSTTQPSPTTQPSSTTQPAATPQPDGSPDPHEAFPPIRWPHPDRFTLVVIGAWVLGMLCATVLPAAIVPPSGDSAPGDQVALALGATLLGAAVMLACGIVLWRHTRDFTVLAFGAVPAATVVIGGIILAGTKLIGR